MQLTGTFYSLIPFTWLYIFLHVDYFLPSYFTSPQATLDVIIDAQTFVDNNDSTCSTLDLVCTCIGVHHLGGKTQ